MTDDPPAVPDNSARRAREEIAKLTELAWRHPESWYYQQCLAGWIEELANPTKYKGEDDERTE